VDGVAGESDPQLREPPGEDQDGPVPEDVRRVAAEHGLGELVDVRREVPMGTALVRGGATALVGVVALVLVSYLGQDQSVYSWAYSLVRVVGLFFFFTAFAGFVYVVRALVVGTRAHYLFAGGLVHQRRGGPRVVAWPDVESFRALHHKRGREADGRVLGYQVVVGGRPLSTVPLVLTAGRDPFIDLVVERLRVHGRPIQ
jgi:hypothetical protein